MREVKFRRAHFLHKDNSFERFTFWGPIKGGFQSPSSLSHCFYKEGTDMQFTGLHDKNGKEIYEGDILKKNYGATIRRFAVAWHKERMAFINQDGYNELLFHTPLELCEVIGNIYENEELLSA